jgi:protein gp37
MAENSAISWTDHTFNPWIGCSKVSSGCANCYAERLMDGRMKRGAWGPEGNRQVTSEANWKLPKRWNKKAYEAGRRDKVFCGSLCDVFEDHPVANSCRDRLFSLISLTPSLDWLLLTKRPENIESNLPKGWWVGEWDNVWLGTSIEDNKVVSRMDHLREIPATVRFVSYEPAIGPIDELDLQGVDWLIAGGESGHGYRFMHMEWINSIHGRCSWMGIPFFFKQINGSVPGLGSDLFVQEFPTPRWRLR